MFDINMVLQAQIFISFIVITSCFILPYSWVMAPIMTIGLFLSGTFFLSLFVGEELMTPFLILSFANLLFSLCVIYMRIKAFEDKQALETIEEIELLETTEQTELSPSNIPNSQPRTLKAMIVTVIVIYLGVFLSGFLGIEKYFGVSIFILVVSVCCGGIVGGLFKFKTR